METGEMIYTDEFSYALERGDLLILKLTLNETFSISIKKPRNHLYINDREIIPLQKTVVIGKITIEMETINIDSIEIYVDDVLKYKGNETQWLFDEKAFGTYEIRAVGYHDNEACEDSVEVFMVNW